MTATVPAGPPVAGPRNALTDVAGLRVGHHERSDGGYLTGTTVVLAPPGGMVAGVDVRGGAPGTRETDLLHPTASLQRVHAVTLTGGSAFGLAAAGGVALALEERGVGFDVGPGLDAAGADPAGGPAVPPVVPIVPAAVLFDLGRGGVFRARPDEAFGRAAVEDALRADADRMTRSGLVGAGTGALTCGIKGGLGMASAVLGGTVTVAAMVVANAVGSPLDPRTGELLGARWLLPGDAPDLRSPDPDDARTLAELVATRDPFLTVPSRSQGIEEAEESDDAVSVGPAGTSDGATSIRATTLVVVATDATLSKSQCTKLAGTAHDGLARALNPVHTAYDGDTVFGVSTAQGPVPDEIGLHRILTVSADVVTRALVRALLAARSVATPGGNWSSYSDLAPSAVGSR
ncbi:P1 family peptidase [Nakamurella endophytica]|uniref:L-aminopeptidase/D-esterase-like protein n=1 Tax=Nakamurella endophytica TaxID=1748367 RepID=A0A917SR69_9ACTN|nr:P1 family peptidase [Nakamurella endophytica]GGL93546.1 hypothetical protein GCM10011594_11770 [Nakamurella endophytica]